MSNQNHVVKIPSRKKFYKNPKIVISIIVLLILGFGVYKIFSPKKSSVQYQTSIAEKGTLISSISASGSISSGNNLAISTEATGVIDKVLVKNGDKVKQGKTIATISLDQDSKQKQTSAWSNVLSAQNQLASAQANIYQLQAAAFKADQKFRDQAKAQGLSPDDPTYVQQQADAQQTAAQYKNQANVIAQAQASLNNAYLSYQK
jgi:HlyD family secretion protein